MNLDEVTLVVPTKNEARNIDRFLDAIPSGIPIIIVDASSDHTRDILRRRQRQSLRVISDEGNIAAARQIAAEEASTDWLLYSDADVTFAEDYFDRLAQFRPGRCLGGVVGAKASRGKYRCYYRLFSEWMRLCLALGLPAASGSNMIVRRQALVDAGGFDRGLSCNEDSEFMWRIQRYGYRVNYDGRLRVYEVDHRRLDRGVLRKTVHSLARCALIFCGLDRTLKRSDWGYWVTVDGQ
jgi:glycosyltransferase involved in cell wall biosynthesis